MATDRMYELAFAFRKEELWKKLNEDELFAVTLGSGLTGYCSVMGLEGSLTTLVLYVGDEALRALLETVTRDPLDTMRTRAPELLRHNCIQCVLENRDVLDDAEAEEVLSYARRHGIVLRGSHAFPRFIRHRPWCMPWFVTEADDQADLILALEAAEALAGLLKDRTKKDLGFHAVRGPGESIPLLVRNGDRFDLTRTTLPRTERRLPEPRVIDELAVARLKKQTQKGTLECELIRGPMPIREAEDEIPWFPAMLMAVDKGTGMISTPVLSEQPELDPEAMVNSFVRSLTVQTWYPKRIEYRTDETAALLSLFCKTAGIRLVRTPELPELDLAVEDLDKYSGGAEDDDEEADTLDHLTTLTEMMVGFSDAELQKIPPLVATQTLELAELGVIPPELADRLRRLFPNL